MGTQSGDYGCRDGNNICWSPRGLGCNVGDGRCSYLTGSGEGVIYAVRESNLGSSVPSVPQNLAATQQLAEVTLTWTKPATDGGRPTAQYTVYRGAVSGSLSPVGTSNTTSFLDTTAPAGAPAYYAV